MELSIKYDEGTVTPLGKVHSWEIKRDRPGADIAIKYWLTEGSRFYDERELDEALGLGTAWSALVEFVEEHGGSLSGEGRERLFAIARKLVP